MEEETQNITAANPVTVKRWNAYTCPDCRGIFRAPRDYPGLGIVCPLCDRMLRLPREGDLYPAPSNIAPLTEQNESPQERIVAATNDLSPSRIATIPHPVDAQSQASSEHDDNRVIPLQRPNQFQENEWGQTSTAQVARFRNANSFFVRYRFFLISFGVLLLILLVAVVVKEFRQPAKPTTDPIISAIPIAETPLPNPAPPAKNEFRIMDLESAVRGFMNAESIDEMKKFIYLDDSVERKVNAYYAAVPWKKIGFSSILEDQISISLDGKVVTVKVTDRNFEEQDVALRVEPEKYLIDWESWVAWGQMTLDEILTLKPRDAVEVRLQVANEIYFNFDFPKDQENQWVSFKLSFRNEDRVLHGYAPRAGELHDALRLQPDELSRNMILRIRFPANSTSSNQVLIDSVIQDGWVKP